MVRDSRRSAAGTALQGPTLVLRYVGVRFPTATWCSKQIF